MTAEKKTIAVIGAGPVGCAFAVHLVNAGHDVTIVGRGQRLANLQRNRGVLTKKSKKSTEISKTPVKAVGELDIAHPWDLIILTITQERFDESLSSTLKACTPKTEILFMFNTFASLDEYFDALGKKRCIIGFPSITASFYDGVLVHRFLSFGQVTLVSSPVWRSIFTDARISCVHESDMQSWLRTHACMAAGIQGVVVVAAKKKSGATWTEAQLSADAIREGLALVQKLGNKITPGYIYHLVLLPPSFILAGLLWVLSRIPSVRNHPQALPNWERESLGLLDSMLVVTPRVGDLRAIRQLRSKCT